MRRQNSNNNRGYNNNNNNNNNQYGQNNNQQLQYNNQSQQYNQQMNNSPYGQQQQQMYQQNKGDYNDNLLTMPKTLFTFLAQNNAFGKVKPLKRDGNNVTVGPQVTLQFENGITFALAIPRVCQRLGIPVAPARQHLAMLQPGASPKARLTNWNAVLNVLNQ